MNFVPDNFDFSDEMIDAARFGDTLLSLELELSRACNYRCPYCYVSDISAEPDELTHDEIKRVITEAAWLGAKKIVILGGEPLLYKRLLDVVDHINSLGMGAEIFTNGALVDAVIAARLAERNTRIVIKINSLQAEIQDELTGVSDSLAAALRAIALLQNAGFDTPERLGGSSIISSANFSGVVALYEYLRQHRIKPYFEVITPQGRAINNSHLMIAPQQLKIVFEKMAAIDRAAGIDWKPQVPLVGSKCLRHWYSAVVGSTGEVFPCVGVTIKIGQVREQSLENILKGSAVINKLKRYRDLIKQPCRNCTQTELCYGCRGAAYQLTGDYLAPDPTCWHYPEANVPLKILPYPAGQLLPHKKPIIMVDRLIELGEYAVVEAAITADNPFLTDAGDLPNAALIELAAQAAGAAHIWENDLVIMPGILSGGANVNFFDTVKVGDVVYVAVKEIGRFESSYLIEFNITRGGQLLAKGELKLLMLENTDAQLN
jgi:radical SAM protein with 4Fe4S-binding SPASM domain